MKQDRKKWREVISENLFVKVHRFYINFFLTSGKKVFSCRSSRVQRRNSGEPQRTGRTSRNSLLGFSYIELVYCKWSSLQNVIIFGTPSVCYTFGVLSAIKFLEIYANDSRQKSYIYQDIPFSIDRYTSKN